MTPPRSRGVAAALLTAMVLAACGGSGRAVAETAPGTSTDRGDTSRPTGAAARADTARQPYTAADVNFMSTMIGHHGQAIAMARMAATHGASPSIRTLAERIINGQQDEIAIMQRWLRERGQPVPEPRADGMGMTVNRVPHEHLMPGMLTADQMKRLDQARGQEFDRLFLQFMIQHHQGAVSMVRELIASAGAAHDDAVFKLASDINVDQTTEIDRMQRMLAALLIAPGTR